MREIEHVDNMRIAPGLRHRIRGDEVIVREQSGAGIQGALCAGATHRDQNPRRGSGMPLLTISISLGKVFPRPRGYIAKAPRVRVNVLINRK